MGVLQLLIRIIQGYQHTPFLWGKFDCALFVANVLRDLYGVDYAASLRGTYNTEIGSHRILKQYGGLDGFLDQHFNRLDPMYAGRGDIILIQPRTVGICIGRRVACVTENDGIIYLPLKREEVDAWRVTQL